MSRLNGVFTTESTRASSDVGVTGLLERALCRLQELSADEQDAIASRTIETRMTKEPGMSDFVASPSGLRDLARDPAKKHRRGEDAFA